MTEKKGRKSVRKNAVKKAIKIGVSLEEGIMALENNSNNNNTKICGPLKSGIGNCIKIAIAKRTVPKIKNNSFLSK